MTPYEKAIESLLAKIEEAETPTDAARLAEVAINLAHAAVAMDSIKKDRAIAKTDNGSAGG